MELTRKVIENAIEEKLNLPVKLWGSQETGGFYFGATVGIVREQLVKKRRIGVDAGELNDLSIEEWVNKFSEIWESEDIF